MTNYRYLSSVPDHLDTGRPLAFGDDVALDVKQAITNARLIDSGALVEVVKSKAPTTKTETQEVS